MVRSVKTPLKKIVGNAILSEIELTTILCRIEAQINSHPLTSVSNSLETRTAITPAELINRRPLHKLDMAEVTFSPPRRYKYVQIL